MRKLAPALVLIALVAAGQMGCRACGGSHLDYASPVAGCAYGTCGGGCRAGSVHGETVITSTMASPTDGGNVVIEEAPSPIPAAPAPTSL